MTVASTVIHHGRFTAAGYSSGAVCPAGHTFLLKSFSVYNESTVGAIVQLGTTSAAGNVFYHCQSLEMGAAAIFHLELWVVVLPSEQAFVHSSAAGVCFWVSGSDLIGVAAWTPPPMIVTPQLLLPAELPS